MERPNLSASDYYVLGLLMRRCGSELGAYERIEDIFERSAVPFDVDDNVKKLAVFGLIESEQFANSKKLHHIRLNEDGIYFCLRSKFKILRAVSIGRRVSELFDVQEAFDRLEDQYGYLNKMSGNWSGNLEKYSVSEASRQNILSKLNVLNAEVEGLPISQTEKAQIRAYVTAAIIVAEAPEPGWKIIMAILIVLSGIASIASAITGIIQLIEH
jgi:hypothetical protein